jgi:tRNA A-37 threonylcarbamoyl transferase component Bud32
MRCGTATPTDPGVPQRTQSTGAFEIAQVTKALVGRYRIERVLGEGGMATVYLAEDAKHKRKVAVKVMRPELAATLGAERFLREVQIAAQLSHPHILPMHDSGEADGLLYYVMPYVDGETLKERLAREGALAPDEAVRLAREVADALAYAHKRGIIHRDIKPANILLNEGYALVADFGIARALEDGSNESLTRTGLAVGTPQYMAPEQATGEKLVDGRADVYATGRRALRDAHRRAAVHRVERAGHPDQEPDREAEARHAGASEPRAGAGHGGAEGAGEGRRGAIRVGDGVRGGARVDARDVVGRDAGAHALAGDASGDAGGIDGEGRVALAARPRDRRRGLGGPRGRGVRVPGRDRLARRRERCEGRSTHRGASLQQPGRGG